MVEQICEKCGARYSLYAPACPKCGAPSTQPAKKPGCPQAPAPAPKPAKAPAAAPREAADKQTVAAQSEKSVTQVPSTITVENASACPCRKLATNPLALIGIAVAVFGIFRLFKR